MAFKKKNFKQKTLLYVEWQDASGQASWTTAAEELKCEPFVIQNVGWFVGYSTGNCLVLTSQIDVQGNKPGMVSHIPLGMVIKVKEMKNVAEFNAYHK